MAEPIKPSQVKTIYLVELPSKGMYLDSFIDETPVGLLGCNWLNGIIISTYGSTEEKLNEEINKWQGKAKKFLGKQIIYFPTSLALKSNDKGVARYVTEGMLESFCGFHGRRREVPTSVKDAVNKRIHRQKEELKGFHIDLNEEFKIIHVSVSEGKPTTFEDFNLENIETIVKNAKDYILKNRTKRKA